MMELLQIEDIVKVVLLAVLSPLVAQKLGPPALQRHAVRGIRTGKP